MEEINYWEPYNNGERLCLDGRHSGIHVFIDDDRWFVSYGGSECLQTTASNVDEAKQIVIEKLRTI